MAYPLPTQRLLRVSKACKDIFDNWEEGVSLANDSRITLTDLRLLVSKHRWELALERRRQANVAFRPNVAQFRCAISRYYYAMYHAVRAAVFIYHGGDDFEEHSKLSLHIPADFPNQTKWQAALKDARLLRNRADYDPYPKANRAWESDARHIRNDAIDLLAQVNTYLTVKGCRI
jgi:uncharacterized protein (UPF0332 family)